MLWKLWFVFFKNMDKIQTGNWTSKLVRQWSLQASHRSARSHCGKRVRGVVNVSTWRGEEERWGFFFFQWIIKTQNKKHTLMILWYFSLDFLLLFIFFGCDLVFSAAAPAFDKTWICLEWDHLLPSFLPSFIYCSKRVYRSLSCQQGASWVVSFISVPYVNVIRLSTPPLPRLMFTHHKQVAI